MANKVDYEDVLNPAQLEAVMATEGPILVIAGAGSGKTRTLVYRVARLVEKGVPPESILLLTFTKKASQEMLDRAESLCDSRCRFVSGGTFHSLANKVLRNHAGLIGFSNGFTILDRPDMEQVLSSLVPELGMPKGIRFPKRGTIANILSKSANLQEPVNQFVEEEYAQFIEYIPEINRLAELYARYKRENHLMDYDDLLLNLRRILAEHIDVRKELSRQYTYIMVDEYQDTNSIQAEILKWLAFEHKNIMIVGDDSQAIYSFRGADYKNMFDFPKQFPDARLIKLEQNYRSTQPILTFTNALMDHAAEKYTKCLFTERRGGEKPIVVNTRTEPEQAGFICRYIKEQLQRGKPISDFAVLFRAGYHSFELEAELTRQNIPYIKYGGFKFLESAHIKDFLAHMRVVVNRDDAVSWVRILTLVKNIGQAKAQNVIRWMKENRIPPKMLGKWPGLGKGESGLKPLSELLARLVKKEIKPKKAVETVMRYYLPIMEEKFDDYPRRQKELEQLIPMAERYKRLRGFLDDLLLEPPTSSADIDPLHKEGSLILSTVHSAKGLELQTVFIIWVVDGRFPPVRAFDNPLALEEERRLMYVAATRAKDRLIICYPGEESAPVWQQEMPSSGNGLSTFIQSLPPYVYSHKSTNIINKISLNKQYNTSREPYHQDKDDNHQALAQGDMVRHPAFGNGIVSKRVDDNKVEILFKNAGKKLLHLEYTTLDKIS